ncbi:lysostaphin resistance A-like protein [Massilia sp. X63]|uniref:CPBP family intramembrane glutamic endopeptidase n=1 Tax=Massilia sp. X63 TaxID=3237285 RepID=UPI0034DCF783
MKKEIIEKNISIWNILVAVLLAKMFALFALLYLKNNTTLNVGISTFTSRLIELIIFLWLISEFYKPIQVWLSPILVRNRCNGEKHDMWKTIFLIFVFSAISRYFIEIITIGITSVLDPQAIDDIRMSSNDEGIAKLFRLLVEGKVLAQITIVPLVEEIIYRGILFNYFLRRQKALVALVLTSAIFAIPHGNSFAAFLGGIVFGSIYLYTGRLAYCVLAHATTNFTIVALYIFPEKTFTFFAEDAITPLPHLIAISAAITWLFGFGIYYLKQLWKKLDSSFDAEFNKNGES